ncbi:unnamed protein product, partial [Closterium sp. NIES-53]
DLITHLRTSDTRYRAALKAKFLDKNPPPMYITLYFLVTRLPESLRAVRDHFLALDPTYLTVDLLEKHLLAAETSIVAVGAARGTPRTPFFQGCSPSPLAPSYASAAAVDILEWWRWQRGWWWWRQWRWLRWRWEWWREWGLRWRQWWRKWEWWRRVGHLWVVFAACMSFAQVTALVRHAGSFTHSTAASPALTTFGAQSLATRLSTPHWLELLRSRVDIFALDYDAILAAMYALTVSAEVDCYLCVLLDLGIEAAALGASESALRGTAPVEALHTFTLDSGASRCFFRDSTTLTPLPAPVLVRLADPSGGPVLACSTTVLTCPAVPFGSLSGLHLPSFSPNLVSTTAFHDVMVTTTTTGGQRVAIYMCTRTGHHLTTFTRRPGSSMYTLTTKPAQANAVRYAAHQLNLWPRVSLPETSPTLRWTGKVGDASVFRVWGSCAIVRYTSADKLSSRAIPCVFLGFPPYAHGWQFYHRTSRRVLPSQDITFDELIPFYHLFPYDSAPLPPPDSSESSGPTPSGVSQVDPLALAEPVKVTVDSGTARGGAARGAASGVAELAGAEPGGAEPVSAEPWGAETESAEPWCADSEGAESGGAEPRGTASAGGPASASPRQSRRREPLSQRQLHEWFARRTCLRSGAAGARGHAAGGTGAGGAGATSPGGAGVTGGAGGTGGAGAAGPRGARTRGTRAAGAGCVGGAEARDPGAGGFGAGGAGAGGIGAGDPEAGGNGAGDLGAGGAGTGGAGAGGAGVGGGTGAVGAGARGAGAGGGGAGGGGAGVGGTGDGGVGAGGPGAGGAGAGGAGAGGTGAGGTVQQRPFFVPPPPSYLPPPGSVFRQVLSLSFSTGLTPHLLCAPLHQSQPQLQPDSPLPAPSPYAEQTDSLTERREPGSRPASPVRAVHTGRRVPCPRPPHVPGTHIMALRPSSIPLRVPLPSPLASSLADGPDPESDLARAASPTVTRLLASVVTEASVEFAAASSLVAKFVDFAAACRLDYAASLVANSESDCPPSVGDECALGADVLEDRKENFKCLAAAIPHLVAMLLAPEGDPDAPDCYVMLSFAFTSVCLPSYSDCPPSVGDECALGTDVLEDRKEDLKCLAAAIPHLVAMLLAPEGDPDAPDIPTTRSYTEAITGPYSSQWQSAIDAEIALWRSTGTYVDAVPPPGANIVDGMWIFRVKRPPGSPPAFKARYVARGFSQRQRVDFFHTFSPTPKMTTLRGSMHEEIWLRRPLGFTVSFPAGTQWSLWRPVYSLRQAPREWHDTLRTTLAALGFAPSTADPSLFLRTNTSLPPFYILVYVDDLFFATTNTEAMALENLEL